MYGCLIRTATPPTEPKKFTTESGEVLVLVASSIYLCFCLCQLGWLLLARRWYSYRGAPWSCEWDHACLALLPFLGSCVICACRSLVLGQRFCACGPGPWILKAGWGPLARVEFAIEAGIARKDRPSTIFSLVRQSRVAFARKHHPAYEDFLRRKLEEEEIDGRGVEGQGEGRERGSGEALHPLAWGSSVVKRHSDSDLDSDSDSGVASSPRNSELDSESAPAAAGRRTRTAKLKNAGAKLENVVSESGDGGQEEEEEREEDLMKRTALEVAELEDALGRGRKSRLAGVKDRPPKLPQPLARLRGSPQDGDALLDLGQEEIVAYDSAPQRRLGA